MRFPTRRSTAALLTLLFALVTPGVARSVELGIDAGINFQMIDDSDQTITGIGIPLNENISTLSVQSIRLGLPVSGSGQVETSLGFAMVTYDNFSGSRNTFAHFIGGLSYLQPFSSATPRSSPYIRGGVQFRILGASNATPLKQFGMGAGLGYRWRIGQVFGGRIEGHGTRWLENDDISGHLDVSVRLGLSAFSS
jgi:hypothetical protein